MTPEASTARVVLGGHLRRFARVAGRVSWGFADQGVSSLSNFLLGFLVARAVDTATFGAFSIAWATYVVVVGVSRGAVAQPLVVRYSAADPRSWRDASARAGGFALLIGIVVGSLCLLVGVIVGGVVGRALEALSLTMPGLLVQDTWRYAFFAAGRGQSAFVNDLVWLVVQIPALALVLIFGHDMVFAAILAWGGAGTAAALVGNLQAGFNLRPDDPTSWMREHRALIPRYVAEATASLTSSQLSLYAIGAFASLATLGQLRAGQLLIGPILTVLIGLQLVAVPEAVRALAVSVRRLRRVCVASGLSMALVSVAWGAALAIAPEAPGRVLLRANWDPAQEIVLPLALGLAAASFSSGATIGLRAYAAATRSLRATVISSAMATATTVVGAVMAGASGAAWGIAIAHLVGIAIWWREFGRATDDYLAAERSGTAAQTTDPST
jgi:O-antigen/teichoic acid export membrane protein